MSWKKTAVLDIISIWECAFVGAGSSIFDWATMLQVGMLRFQNPMMWINFFNLPNPSKSTRIYLILLTALGPWTYPAADRNEYRKQRRQQQQQQQIAAEKIAAGA
jgi:hypothetical protein